MGNLREMAKEVNVWCQPLGNEAPQRSTWPEEIMRRATTGALEMFDTTKEWDHIERQSRHCYFESFSLMTDWNMLSQVELDVLNDSKERIWGTYFQVIKSEELQDDGVTVIKERAIQNCRPQNSISFKPPSFGLIRPRDILELLSYWEHPKVSSSDGRAWFHELTLPEEARRFFTLSCGGKVYESQTWPMGAAFAPVIGNVSSLVIMLATKSDKYSFHSPTSLPDVPPPYIIVKEKATNSVCAFQICFLDNHVSISKNEQVRQDMIDILSNNCREERSNALLKVPKDATSPFELFGDAGVFLGVDWDKSRKRGHIHWRHAKTKHWADIAKAGAVVTFRDLARFVGIAVYDATLRLRKLHTVERAIKMMSGRDVYENGGWDAVVTLTTDERSYWKLTMTTILKNQWESRSTNLEAPKEWAFLAWDASDLALGAVLLKQDGTVIDSMREYWTEDEKKMTIYWREVRAAERAHWWALKTRDSSPDRRGPPLGHKKNWALLIDNRGAHFSALSRFSSCPHTCKLLRDWDNWMPAGITTRSTWCRSADQPGDCQSRGLDDDVECCRRGAAILRGDMPVLTILEGLLRSDGLMKK